MLLICTFLVCLSFVLLFIVRKRRAVLIDLFALFNVLLALKNSAKKTCCLIDLLAILSFFLVRVRIKNSAKRKCFWCEKATFIKIVRLRNKNSAIKTDPHYYDYKSTFSHKINLVVRIVFHMITNLT